MDTTVHWLTTAFDGLVAFLPSLVAGLVILLIGYVVASVLGSVTRRLAHRLGFDRLVARIGFRSERFNSSQWLGRFVYYVILIAALLQAARAWHMEMVSVGLAAIIAYLPHVIAAAIILGVAIWAGNWARARLLGRTDETGALRLLPTLVRGGIIAIGTFMALRELQIAPEIVNAAFIILLGAVGVAGAIAFGLGGREVAGKIAQSWYERRSELTRRGPPGISVTAEE